MYTTDATVRCVNEEGTPSPSQNMIAAADIERYIQSYVLRKFIGFNRPQCKFYNNTLIAMPVSGCVKRTQVT